MTAQANVRPDHWPYRADIPQRYNDNAQIYLARGGKVRLQHDVEPFVAHGDNGDISRFFFFCLMHDQIAKEGLAGELAELGVYKGNTAGLLANIARQNNRTLYLLDTFEGFNHRDITGIDADKQPEQFTDTSLESVRQRVGDDNVRYIKGYFPETTRQMPDDLRFCLVHIDCDLYEPITAALRYFYPRMTPGGFIVVHDYTSLAWNGAEKAVDEFFADKPEFVIPLTDGCGSAVIRRMRDAAHHDGTQWSIPGTTAGRFALLDGWSAIEDWGVWGIGERHVLRICNAPAGMDQLEVDCSAALVGVVTHQVVDVSIGGTRLQTWEFGATSNRAVRSLRLPPAAGAEIELTFRARTPVCPAAQRSDSSDDRLLGLALHRIRLTWPARTARDGA